MARKVLFFVTCCAVMSVAAALSFTVVFMVAKLILAVGTEPLSTIDEISKFVSFVTLITSLVSMCLKIMLMEFTEGSTSDLLAAIKSEIP